MDDDFTPPPVKDLELQRDLRNAQRKIEDLEVIIDTAQAALRRAESSISGPDYDHVFNQSAKWVMSYQCS